MLDRLKSWLLPSIADAFFASILLLLALPTGQAKMLADGDTGYHVRVGEYILRNLTVPTADIFSFITPAIPWTTHEWLSEVAMALLHQLGGLNAVVIVYSLIIAVSIRLFFTTVRREGNNVLLSIGATIAFLSLAMTHFLARPHIFSLLLLVVWYRLLDDFQYRERNHLWLLPLVMLLWVNLHGGFIIGLALLGLYVVGNLQLKFTDKIQWKSDGNVRFRKLACILGLSTFACIVNPIGYRILLFPFKLLSNKYIMDHVHEFQSPDFHDLQPFKYLLLLLILILAYSNRRPNTIEIVLVLLFTSMSLYSVRYIPLFGVIVVPILLRHLEDDCLSRFPQVESFFRKRAEDIAAIDSTAKGYLWPALCLIFLALIALSGVGVHSLHQNNQPLAALDFLKDNPVTGNMYNDDEFGDYVIYAASDRYKVFIDGRIDMYGSERLKEYRKVYKFEPGWDAVLEKYKMTWVFFETRSALARFLSNQPDWHLIYSDKIASIFVKKIPDHRQLIQEFSSVELAN